MGLSSTTNRVAFAGDGSSTVFSFPYYFFNQADLQVYLFDTGSSTIFPQVLNTNYTVSGSINLQGVYPKGGAVVMNSAFPSNLEIVITRSPSMIQNYVLNQNGQINSLALVQQFDYLTALVQRLQDEVSRCVSLPDGMGPVNGSSFGPTLPSAITIAGLSANSPIVVNSGGNGLALGFVIGSSGFTGTAPVTNGGTGQNSPLTQYALWYSQTVSSMGQIASVGTGNVLQSNGSSAPSWLAFSAINSVSNIVSRDVNGNTVLNNVISGLQTIAATGTSTILLASSPRTQLIIGSSSQNFNLPDATTLSVGQEYNLNNNTNANVTVNDFTGTLLLTVPAGAYTQFSVANNATQKGTWDYHSFLPKQTGFGSSGLNLSTGSSVSGVLPVVNGGTGQSTYTDGQLLIGNSSNNSLSKASLSAGSNITITPGNGSISIAATGSAAYNVVTKITTYAAAANDYVIASAGAFTTTLPTAVGIAGQSIAIEHAGSSLVAYSIHTTGSQTITSAGLTYSNTDINTTGLIAAVTTGEIWTFTSDNANWRAKHQTATDWSSTLAITPSAGFGTPTSSVIKTRRINDSLEVMGSFTCGTVAASNAFLGLPITIDTSKIQTASAVQKIGYWVQVTSAANSVISNAISGDIFFDGSDTANVYFATAVGSKVYTKFTVSSVIGNTVPITFKFDVPVSTFRP